MFASKYVIFGFLGYMFGLFYITQGDVISETFDRSISGHQICQMPQNLDLTVSVLNWTMTLHLQKTNEVDINAPLFWIVKKSNEEYVVDKGKQQIINGFAEYQDYENGASVCVKCSLQEKGKVKRFHLEGQVYMKGKEYQLSSMIDINGRRHTKKLRLKEKLRLSTFDSKTSKMRNIRHHGIGSRFRRANGHLIEYNIDVLVVIDYLAFRDWHARSANMDETISNIKEYFAHVMNGVNLRYKSVVIDGYTINVHLVGYIVSQSLETSPWTELNKQIVEGKLRLSADKVLESLKDWVNQTELPAHDHVMLFTEYDLFGDDGGSNYTTGLAFIGTMCQGHGRSVSLVEDHGGFQSVGTAAHELGHSLGAEHDGDNNTCTPRDRYIMAGASFDPNIANRYNPWHFSPCSVRYFTKYIQTILDKPAESACLKNTIRPVGVPDVSNQMPGQLLGPDDQCRQMYGHQSYMCRGEHFGGDTDICRAMFCRNPETANKCVLHTAARGTTCASEKWCIDGMCVYDKRAPTTSDECVFGDRSGIVMKNRTCQEMVSEAAGYCYMADFKMRCCSSCAAKFTGVPGCEFGDRVLQCSDAYCGRKFDDGSLYDINCCGICNYKPNITTTTPITTQPTQTPTVPEGGDCLDYSLVDNKPCIQYVNTKGRNVCYEKAIQRRCCKTCETLKLNLDNDCPWGDQRPLYCNTLTASMLDDCPVNMCCAICAKHRDFNNRPTQSPTDTNTVVSKGHNSGVDTSCSIFTFFVLLNILTSVCDLTIANKS